MQRLPFYHHMSLAMLAIFFLASSAFAQSEVRVTNDLEYGVTSVSGPGAGLSIRTDNGNYINTFGVVMNTDTGPNNYYLNINGRATDDIRVNSNNSMLLTGLQGRFARGEHIVNVGDTFESYSQYSLSTGLKGLSYKFANENGHRPDVTLLYGFDTPSWDTLSSGHASDVIRRQAYGAQVKHQLGPLWSAGVHYVHSSDSDRVSATDPLYDGDVYGVTWDFHPFDGLSLTGENSFSTTTESPSATEADTKYHGDAHRLSFRGEGDNFTLNVDYSRVSPLFLSVLGSATADRERARARWRQRNGRDTTLTYSAMWYRDNLDDQKTVTTDAYQLETRMAQRRIFDRRYATLDAGYRVDIRQRSDDETNHYLDLGYQDRLGVLDVDGRVGVIAYATSNDVRNAKEYTANMAVGTRYTLGSAMLRPSLQAGTRLADDELRDLQDRIYEVSLGSQIDFPDSNISSNVRLGYHELMSDGGDDTSKFFTNISINYRPRGNNALTNSTYFLRWQFNDFSSTDDGNVFKDNTLAMGVNTRF